MQGSGRTPKLVDDTRGSTPPRYSGIPAPAYESKTDERRQLIAALRVLDDLAYTAPVWRYGAALDLVIALICERIAATLRISEEA